MSHEQQLVQSCHAAIEASCFIEEHLDHPHLVVCGVKGEINLHKVAKKLEDNSIRYRGFIEPDRNNELTSIATEPVFGKQRQFFKRYRCLDFKLERGVA